MGEGHFDAVLSDPIMLSEQAHVSVERAIAELRAERPVVVRADGRLSLVTCVEALDAATTAALQARLSGAAHLVLTAARLRHLGSVASAAGVIALASLDKNAIRTLALAPDARLAAALQPLERVDEAALELSRLAMLLPAVVVGPLREGMPIHPLLDVNAEAVLAYRLNRLTSLKIVSRAPVPLGGAAATEFVVFRGGEGLREQVAVIVGRPDTTLPVTVRLHSACLTGDLFGSLKCDCGDQLRNAVHHIANSGGGILLYLDQEGRGTGIANKIRAYELQSIGYDTYDADEVLGFEADGRRFDFAAHMLLQLGVTKVSLLTNNPEKIRALQRGGLEVVSHERILGRSTDQNAKYLAAKRDRGGHFIASDAVFAASSCPPD